MIACIEPREAGVLANAHAQNAARNLIAAASPNLDAHDGTLWVPWECLVSIRGTRPQTRRGGVPRVVGNAFVTLPYVTERPADVEVVIDGSRRWPVKASLAQWQVNGAVVVVEMTPAQFRRRKLQAA